jgi:excisionase family DNA binding protein
MDRLLSPDQAGEILGIGTEATRRLCNDGHLAYVRLGNSKNGRIRIRPSDLQAFIDARTVQARPAEQNPALARIRDRRRGQQSA